MFRRPWRRERPSVSGCMRVRRSRLQRLTLSALPRGLTVLHHVRCKSGLVSSSNGVFSSGGKWVPTTCTCLQTVFFQRQGVGRKSNCLCMSFSYLVKGAEGEQCHHRGRGDLIRSWEHPLLQPSWLKDSPGEICLPEFLPLRLGLLHSGVDRQERSIWWNNVPSRCE